MRLTKYLRMKRYLLNVNYFAYQFEFKLVVLSQRFA